MGERRVPHDEVKWGFLGGRVGPCVSGVLCQQQPICPLVLFCTTVQPQVLFQALIHPLALAIRLGVEGQGDVLCDAKDITKFSAEMGSEVGVAVGYDFLGEAEMREDLGCI